MKRKSCFRHPESRAVAACAVCGRDLCAACDAMDGGMHYCSTHMYKSMRANWRPPLSEPEAPEISSRKWGVALVLTVTGGLAGLHRLYLGRIVSGGLRLALTVVVFAAVRELDDSFFKEGLRSPASWFAAIAVFSGGVQLLCHVFGAGFLSRGLLPIGKEGRRSPKYYPAIAKMIWVRPQQPLPPQWYSDAAPKVLLAVLLAIYYFMIPAGENGRIKLFFLAFVGCVSLSGMLWALDLLLVAENRLTDCRGRVLQ